MGHGTLTSVTYQSHDGRDMVARLWKRVTGWFGPKEPIPESFKTLIIEVARGVITPLAAEELPLFQATCEAFFKDIQHALKVLADQRRPAEMLGFGIEGRTGSITPAVLGVTAEVVHFVAGRVKEVRPGKVMRSSSSL